MTVPSIPFVFSCDQALQRWINIPASVPLTPGDYHAPAHPWHPRTAPRPTDQISGELKEPALSAWLGIDPYIGTPTDESEDIPFIPVPPPPASNPTDTERTEPLL